MKVRMGGSTPGRPYVGRRGARRRADASAPRRPPPAVADHAPERARRAGAPGGDQPAQPRRARDAPRPRAGRARRRCHPDPNPRRRLRPARPRRRRWSARATTAAPARRTPRSTRWPRAGDRRPRRHRRRHPRALQPHRPHRAVRRRRCVEAGVRPGRATPQPTRPGAPAGAPTRCAPPASRSRAALLADEARARQPGLDLRRRTHGRPFVTWKFAATLDGRSAAADGTQPLDHRARVARRHPPAARRVRRDRWSAPAPCSPTTPQLTVRDEDGDRCRATAAAARGRWALRDRRRPTAGCSTTPRRDACCCATRDPRARRLAALLRALRRGRHVLPRGRPDAGRGVPARRAGRRGRRLRRAGAARRRARRAVGDLGIATHRRRVAPRRSAT